VIPRTRSNLGSALAFPVSCGGSLCLGPVFLGARRLHHNIPGFIPNRCSHLGLSTPPDQSTRFRSHPGNPPLWSARSPLAPRDGSLIRNSASDHRSRFATFHPARGRKVTRPALPRFPGSAPLAGCFSEEPRQAFPSVRATLAESASDGSGP
jgi:hypothetical protein